MTSRKAWRLVVMRDGLFEVMRDGLFEVLPRGHRIIPDEK